MLAVQYLTSLHTSQELRNIMWIAECVAQNQKARITDGIVYIF